MTNTAINKEKLAKLQEQVRIGGKGTPRRKIKKSSKTSTTDDKSMVNNLRKLGVQPLASIDEVNMFMKDETILHFAVPKVQAAVSANTFLISGPSSHKELTELAPGIIEQLSPESLEKLRQMADEYMRMSSGGAALNEDAIPHLIKKFETKSLGDQ